MKIGIAIYHANAQNIYPREWMDKCVDSMSVGAMGYTLDSLKKKFKCDSIQFYELNYGNDNFSVLGIRNFRSLQLENYAEAMNEIYSWIFETCDVVFNTNLDDWYSSSRIECSLKAFDEGYDIVSSNYLIMNSEGSVIRSTDFATLDIYDELCKGNNIVSNPGHAMKKHVFEKLKFDPSLVPREDMAYWKKCIEAGFTIKIRPEYLHYYRQHPNQSGNQK